MTDLAALVRAASPFLDLLGAVPWIADSGTLRLRQVGEQVHRLFGDPSAVWLEGPALVWLERVAAEDRPAVVAARRRVAAGQPEARPLEYRARTAAGAEVQVLELLQRVQGTDRELLMGLSFVRGRAAPVDLHALNNALAAVGCLDARPVRDEPAARDARGILVVDDDAELRRMVARLLGRAGYEVHVSSSVEPALDALGRAGVELLVTDLALDGGVASGLALIERALARRPGLRVLVASGHANARDLLPPDARFLAKPFTPRMLLEAVGASLR